MSRKSARPAAIWAILTGFACFSAAAPPDGAGKKRGAGSPTSRPAKRTYAAAPPYASVREMSPAARRVMNSRRYHIYRLKRQVVAALKCRACQGAGQKKQSVMLPDRGGTGTEAEVKGVCRRCRGLKILPNANAHAALSDYVRHEAAYKRDYPFAAAMDTGLFGWIARHINTANALAVLNEFAHAQIADGRRRPGDVFLIGVEILNTETVKSGKIMQAWLDPVIAGQTRDESNLVIEFTDSYKQAAFQNLLMVVVYNGRTEYETLAGDTASADIFRCLGWKAISIPTR